MIGPRPSAGARYVLERAREDDDAVVYAGFVFLPDAELPIEVRVALPSGAATAAHADGADPPAFAAEIAKAAALVRSATRSAVAAGGALPRKIVRWRG